MFSPVPAHVPGQVGRKRPKSSLNATEKRGQRVADSELPRSRPAVRAQNRAVAGHWASAIMPGREPIPWSTTLTQDALDCIIPVAGLVDQQRAGWLRALQGGIDHREARVNPWAFLFAAGSAGCRTGGTFEPLSAPTAGNRSAEKGTPRPVTHVGPDCRRCERGRETTSTSWDKDRGRPHEQAGQVSSDSFGFSENRVAGSPPSRPVADAQLMPPPLPSLSR